MADIVVTVGVEQKKRINLELQARKSLDGNILIFDHKEIDIVIMPLKRKIVTFAKSEINDSVYEVQNRFFNFLKRHKCNPGLTGWAQVNGLRGATPDPSVMKRRMEFDLWYLNNWTIWLDIKIIFRTFAALIKYKGD